MVEQSRSWWRPTAPRARSTVDRARGGAIGVGSVGARRRDLRLAACHRAGGSRFRRVPRRRRFQIGAISAALVVLSYLPWVAFQRLVSPPGYRLLKWHLAGVVAVDGRSFIEEASTHTLATSVADIVAARFANLSEDRGRDCSSGSTYGPKGLGGPAPQRRESSSTPPRPSLRGCGKLVAVLVCVALARRLPGGTWECKFPRGLVVADRRDHRLHAAVGCCSLRAECRDRPSRIEHGAGLAAVPFAWTATRWPKIATGGCFPHRPRLRSR